MTIPRDLSNLAPGANTSGVLGVGRGGTGATTLTGVLKGNGTSAFQDQLNLPTADQHLVALVPPLLPSI
jgi:hypothetical protein